MDDCGIKSDIQWLWKLLYKYYSLIYSHVSNNYVLVIIAIREMVLT